LGDESFINGERLMDKKPYYVLSVIVLASISTTQNPLHSLEGNVLVLLYIQIELSYFKHQDSDLGILKAALSLSLSRSDLLLSQPSFDTATHHPQSRGITTTTSTSTAK
jgi:hypothetical protein